jgi:STE24 endopeptidase
VLVVIMLAEAYGEAAALLPHSLHPRGAGIAVGAWLAFFAVFVAGAILSTLATHRAIARIRGLPSQTGGTGQRQARILVAAVAPQLIWVMLFLTLHDLHGTAEVAVLPVWIAYLVAIVVFWPALVVAVLRTKALDSALRQRLFRFAGEHQVRIRDIRCLDTGPEQAANAVMIGLVPRFRYVLLTDRLLRELEPDELEAVLAHELGHAKKHHLLIKFGAMLVVWLPAGGVLAAAAALGGHRSAVLIAAGMVLWVILVMASVVVVQGVIGVRLERSADDYASATSSAGALRRGLEKLAAANAMKRRTGRAWNLLTQHPGMDQRIERLRQAGPRPHPAR